MTGRKHAEIAGGGLAALTAGARLAQAGWTVRLHERSPIIRDTGSGIYLWENGLRVLEALGAYETAVAGAVAGRSSEYCDRGGPRIRRVPPDVKARMRIVSVPRQQLLTALADVARTAGVEIVTGSEASGADPAGRLHLTDGRTLNADLVIGADGANSKVRASLGLATFVDRFPDGAIRTMVERLPEDGDDTYVEHWNGTRRILVTPVSADRLYLALTCLDSDARAKALPLDKPTWIESFPHLAAIIRRIGTDARWDLFVTIKVERWSSGRVVLVGDSCHAMAPNLGQGGGLAMANALSLATEVTGIEDDAALPAALERWERRERPLTEHTQIWSWLYGFLTTWPDDLRRQAMEIAGREPWLVEQRFRTALSIPHGAET